MVVLIHHSTGRGLLARVPRHRRARPRHRAGPGTIRRWEALGVIPPPRYQRSTATWGGRRRLYTRGEIDAIASVLERQDLMNRRPQELATSGLHDKFQVALKAVRDTDPLQQRSGD